LVAFTFISTFTLSGCVVFVCPQNLPSHKGAEKLEEEKQRQRVLAQQRKEEEERKIKQEQEEKAKVEEEVGRSMMTLLCTTVAMPYCCHDHDPCMTLVIGVSLLSSLTPSPTHSTFTSHPSFLAPHLMSSISPISTLSGAPSSDS
jgi:hypothetical protein